jgi:hypothetical protein
MGYLALTAFLDSPLIDIDPDIPKSSITPQYLADQAGRQWSLLGASALSDKLLPFFKEFNRLCEEAAKKETPDGRV